MLCLDTNVVITILNERSKLVTDRFLAAMTTDEICLPVVAYFELWHGAQRSQRSADNERQIKAFLLSPVQVLDFDHLDAEHAGDIYALLKRSGTPIGHYDVLIAAQARRRGATLVTANTGEFERVPGLEIEDWSLE
jgi:tRNA(fMet)-specific endonuclease VapC